MNDARGHHFVPQCYLKGFTHNGSKNSQLYVIDLAGARDFNTTPAKVAKKRDFNRIEGLPPGELENRLSGFETKLADALENVGKARKIDDEDGWLHIVNLIGLLAIRNPRGRENVRQSFEQMCRIVLDLTLATPERWESARRQMAMDKETTSPAVSYEKLKDFQDRGEYTVETSPGWHTAMEFKAFDKVLPYLVNRKWLICSAGAGTGGFICSDHPVCLMHSDGSPGSMRRPVGYGLADSTVIFPVNRELLAVGTFEGSGGTRELTQRQVAYFNAVIVGHADRQVYAADSRFFVMLERGISIGRASDLLRELERNRERRP